MNTSPTTRTFVMFSIVFILSFPAALWEIYRVAVVCLFVLSLLGLCAKLLLGAVVALNRRESPRIPKRENLPNVTLIVPIYNEASLLPKTIEAYRELDYPEDRLKVLLSYESSSTDRSPEIVKTAAQGSPIFEAIGHGAPEGKMANVNAALEHCDAEIIGIVDADQRFEPDALKRAVAWFWTDDELWCLRGQTYASNPTESLLALHAAVERDIAELADIYARDVIDGFKLYGGGHVFFRSSVFDTLGNFDETILLDDVEMASRLQLAGRKIRIDPNVVSYGENPSNFEAWCSQRSRWFRGWIQVSVKYWKRLLTDNTLPKTKRIDGVLTLGYWLASVYLIATLPLVVFTLTTVSLDPTLSLILEYAALLLFCTPLVIVSLLYFRYGVGHKAHTPRKYFIPLTLWPYLFLQMGVTYFAFTEHIVHRWGNDAQVSG